MQWTFVESVQYECQVVIVQEESFNFLSVQSQLETWNLKLEVETSWQHFTIAGEVVRNTTFSRAQQDTENGNVLTNYVLHPLFSGITLTYFFVPMNVFVANMDSVFTTLFWVFLMYIVYRSFVVRRS